VDSLSKSELDSLAREMDIKGRSNMTKSELARAVAGHQGKRAS
jgi:DNA end-binding protein Ku